ncbi:glycosyltransferase family 4 protein [uncultured Arthrobacter sp.]|uniref:glycosyltransferase family 4 protein n=1 Tax=uncultured Arthrobacter sp. TaxID=114050 RepID=UPI0028D23237|nr:glycosyltransferase family 4 protein [uncultured Arthrobacter sp.]
MTQQQAPRVTIASRLFAPETGAAAYRLKALANGLAERGAKVRVITTRPPRGLTGANGDYQVSRWPVLRDAGGNVRGYIQYLSFDIPLFFRLLISPKPDVVVVEPPPTTGLIVKTVCRLRRIPYVYFSADVSSSAAKGIGVKGPALRLLTWMERWVLRSAAGVLAVSEGVRQEISALTGREHGIHMVGTGVDTDTFSPVGDARPEEGTFFVYAGTMSEIQGAGVFVDAFALIAQDNPDVRLLMFGQGVELEALKARAEAIGPQVQFRPPTSGSEVASYFRSAIASLASVRPGKGYDFAFATKSLAGLAAGAPTIYAGGGPMVELIEENKLGIVSEWDPASVALAMKAMIASPVSEADRSRLATWTEEHFSLRSVGQAGAERVLSCMKGKA